MAKKQSKKRPTRTARRASSASARPASSRPRAKTNLRSYHIDAFASHPFHGNPAAVVMLTSTKWPADDLLQSIAAEHHLPITAFVLPKGKRPGLRWFSPTREVQLCGHGTLAAAHALWTHEKTAGSSLTFSTPAGDIPVTRAGDLITIALAAIPARKARLSDDLCAALGRAPSELYLAKWLLAVFENKRDVHELVPDMAKLAALDAPGIIVTAPGAGHDFVSRFFSPGTGLNEDYVTGSAHCALAPYWAERLGKSHLAAHQVSHRPGELWCEHKGNRVLISGHATTFARGTITI